MDLEWEALTDLFGMCFYSQKRFSCGDWNWTPFAHRCEYRIGETCGTRPVSETERAMPSLGGEN